MANYEQEDQSKGEYRATSKERDAILKVYEAMGIDSDLCKSPIRYFNYQSKETYINESVKRLNAFIPQRDPRDWRSKVFMNDTGDAAQSILSFVAAQRMRVNVSARKIAINKEKDGNVRITKLIQSLLDYYTDKELGDKKFYEFAYETIAKGTGWRFEGYEKKIRKVKRVTKAATETEDAQYVWEEMVEADNPITYVVPIENVFIPTFYCKDIQKLPHIIIRDLISHEAFEAKYGGFKKAKSVPHSGMLTRDQKEGNYFFYQEWEQRTKEGEVEVLHYYCKETDTYLIIANGVLLNALDNPIPYDHKQYPFQTANFEDFATDFIWGKSIGFKLYSLQDVKNTLVNMAIDKEKFALIPAFLTSLQDETDDNMIYPGARIKISNVDQFRTLDMQGVQNSTINMIEMVDKGIAKASMDDMMKGQVSSETATALLQARQVAIQIMGLYLNQLSWAVYEGARQRIANIIQFVPQLEDAKEGELISKEFRMPGQLLSNGKVGVKVMRMIGDMKQKPSDLEMEDEMLNDTYKAEIVYFTPEDLANIDYFIEIVPTSSVPESKATRKALVLELADRLAPFVASGKVSEDKILDKLLEAYDEQVEDFVAEEQPQAPQGGQPEIPPELLQELAAKQGATSPLVQQLNQTKQPSSKMMVQ